MAGEGYRRAGFCMTPVDTSAERLALYPVDCPAVEPVQADAVSYIANNGARYTLVHASPPCTGYTRGTVAIPDRVSRYDRLIGATREALIVSGVRHWVIENVEGARDELRTPVTLCWTHFRAPGSVYDDDGTPLWMRRHRLFETSFPVWAPGECNHPRDMQCAGAYGGARRDKWEAKHVRRGGYVPSVDVMRRLLETPWMSEPGCVLSVPPFYAEYLGRTLLAQIAVT